MNLDFQEYGSTNTKKHMSKKKNTTYFRRAQNDTCVQSGSTYAFLVGG